MALDAMKKAYTAEVQARTMGPPHWQDGLCSCMDDTNICCQTIWCPVCTMSNMVNKRDYGVAAFDCLSCFCITVGIYYMNRVPVYLANAFRRELVQRYGIREESACSTCVISECCFPCVYCQVQREMGKRKEHCGGCCAHPPAEQPSMADKALAIAGNVLLNGPQAPRTWGSGMCDCTCMECLEVFFCPCVIFGYMNGRLDAERVSGKQAGPMDCASCCGWLLSPDSWTYGNRREVIERYNIFGESHIMTGCKILCCPFCTILQTRREMGYSGEWPGGLCQKEAPPRRQ